MKCFLTPLTVAAVFITFAFAQEIPSGTLLPIQVRTTMKAGKTQAGTTISGKLMQDVPLNEGGRLPAGTPLTGHVVESQAGPPARLVVAFNSIRLAGREVAISTSLRALASMSAIFDAQLPTNLVDDFGSSVRDWNTVQVGGQAVYRGAGIVMSGPDIVGHATGTGLVTAKPLPLRHSPCERDSAANQRQQAFWLFSTDACGVYGFDNLQLAHAGRTDPAGHMTFESSRNIEILGGSGWLLMVNSSGQAAPAAETRSQSATASDTIGQPLQDHTP